MAVSKQLQIRGSMQLWWPQFQPQHDAITTTTIIIETSTIIVTVMANPALPGTTMQQN
jgi:hypothetical protein